MRFKGKRIKNNYKSGRLSGLASKAGAGSPLGYPLVGLRSGTAKSTPSATQTNGFSSAFSHYPPSPLAQNQKNNTSYMPSRLFPVVF